MLKPASGVSQNSGEFSECSILSSRSRAEAYRKVRVSLESLREPHPWIRFPLRSTLLGPVLSSYYFAA